MERPMLDRLLQAIDGKKTILALAVAILYLGFTGTYGGLAELVEAAVALVAATGLGAGIAHKAMKAGDGSTG